jgi:DNA-binding response OmpR family regulator
VPRILVIDDQADVRAVIILALHVKGFEAVGAESAAAGLKAFDESSFDVAIVDIFLEGADGTEVIRTLRERSPDLPIVAISGITPLDFLSGSPEFDNVVCLQKPFRPTALLKAIEAARARFPSPSADDLNVA